MTQAEKKHRLTPRIFFTEEFPIVISDFIICGFVGWSYETIITSVYFKEFVNRGVLPIPILPIYGLFFRSFLEEDFETKWSRVTAMMIRAPMTTFCMEASIIRTVMP